MHIARQGHLISGIMHIARQGHLISGIIQEAIRECSKLVPLKKMCEATWVGPMNSCRVVRVLIVPMCLHDRLITLVSCSPWAQSPFPECPISHSLFPIYPAPFNLSQTTHLLHIPHLIKWLNGPHIQVVGTKVMNQKTCTHTFYI